MWPADAPLPKRDGAGYRDVSGGDVRADEGSDDGDRCTVIEGFESDRWPATGWSGSTLGSLGTGYAHDGAYGIRDPGATTDVGLPWSYRTDVSLGLVGDRITVWVRATKEDSRVYIGFAGSASGCKSFVAAPNTSELLFQDNANWDYDELDRPEQRFTPGQWYKMEIELGTSSTIVGRLFDQDGTTLLNSVTQTFTTSLEGGLALRSWGDFEIDTLSICRL
jgi:hypothetical protein